MKPTPLIEDLSQIDLPSGELHLAIGMFDGVHLGHQVVVESAVHSAQRVGGVSAVLTFWPHPATLVAPKNSKPLIMTPALKLQRVTELGVDTVLFKHFDLAFSQIEAQAFLPYLKQCMPTLSAIYVGKNFAYGHKRQGTVDLLIQQGKAIGVNIISVAPVHYNDEAISSTRIREALKAGDLALANALLGSDYEVQGTVVGGDQRGRTLGFPTLNIPWEPELQPRYGVYAVRLQAQGESLWHDGVANFGVRPTVCDSTIPLLEVHLIQP
ncbi:MAG: riboflavin biosynthesis protein RibF, partial [Verrucomicrobia bacterium 21-51-4]